MVYLYHNIPNTPQPIAEGTRMARTTARVDGATLVLPADDASLIPLDTPVWFAWLEHATTFAGAHLGTSPPARSGKPAAASIAAPDRERQVQRRSRANAGDRHQHGQDPHQQHFQQAPGHQPHPGDRTGARPAIALALTIPTAFQESTHRPTFGWVRLHPSVGYAVPADNTRQSGADDGSALPDHNQGIS